MRIKITEGQLERLKTQINEEDSNLYNREVLLHFRDYNLKIKGHEISEIPDIKVRLQYSIDVDYKSWGIRDISLYNITGPSDIEIEVYYLTESDEEESISIPLKLNWEDIITEVEKGRGIASIDDRVEVNLINDSDGNILVKSIEVSIFTL